MKKLIGTLLALTISLIGGVTIFAFHFNFNITSTPAQASSSQSTSNAVSQTPPTASPIWSIVLNRTYHTDTYNGYQAANGWHFEIVNASFANLSSENQVLSGQLFDLQDSTGQHYTENQASNPGQSFVVDSGQSIQTETAFLVPDSQCQFTLSFVSGTSSVSQWTIKSSLCS